MPDEVAHTRHIFEKVHIFVYLSVIFSSLRQRLEIVNGLMVLSQLRNSKYA